MDKKNVHPYLCVFNSISLCGDRTAFQAARPFLHSFTPNPLTDISNSWCKRCLLFPRALKSFCQHICKTFQDYSLEVNIFSFRPLHLQLRHPLNVLLGDVVVFSFLIWSWKNDWRKDTQLLLELKEHFLNPFFYTKTCYEQISIVEFKTAFFVLLMKLLLYFFQHTVFGSYSRGRSIAFLQPFQNPQSQSTSSPR